VRRGARHDDKQIVITQLGPGSVIATEELSRLRTDEITSHQMKGAIDRNLINRTDSPTLGGQLRSIRARKMWTLKEMSRCTGIPASTLSKVEHNRLSLTYDKLVQLSDRLDIRITELFSDRAVGAEAPIAARRSIGVLDSAKCVITIHQELYYLCPELRGKRMIPVFMKIRAESNQEYPDLIHHPGEEYIYVLKGSVNVLTEFYDPVVLNVNESIYIDTNMRHAYVTAGGCDEATVLALSSRSNEATIGSSL
jgi:transcriptional regulator with XRE-family HTH domain